jgi:glutamyl-Q tRNA(Asp) synthetase
LTAAPVFRFAPSPNGRLHLGHAFSALLNAQLALRLHGRFLLRIEDIDTTRCTHALADGMLADLAWLGLAWEKPARVQSEHLKDYENALAALKERELVYPCFCSRSQVAAASEKQDPDGAPVYPGTCARLAKEEAASRMTREPHSWRIHMAKATQAAPKPLEYRRFLLPSLKEETVAADAGRWGDAILARKDIHTSYHLSVVVDDALQGVTHVVRGRDLEAATDLHVLLQALLGLMTPLYHHHALITLPTGDKLSKSKGGETLADLRARGVTPEEVRKMAGMDMTIFIAISD